MNLIFSFFLTFTIFSLLIFSLGLPLIDLFLRPRAKIVQIPLILLLGLTLSLAIICGLSMVPTNASHTSSTLGMFFGSILAAFILFKRLPSIKKRIQKGNFYQDFTQFERNLNEGVFQVYSTKKAPEADKIND